MREYTPDSIWNVEYTQKEAYFSTHCINEDSETQLVVIRFPPISFNFHWQVESNVAIIYQNHKNYIIQSSFDFGDNNKVMDLLNYLQSNHLQKEAKGIVSKFYQANLLDVCKIKNVGFMDSLGFNSTFLDKHVSESTELWIYQKNDFIRVHYATDIEYKHICPNNYPIELIFWDSNTQSYWVYLLMVDCNKLTYPAIKYLIEKDCDCKY